MGGGALCSPRFPQMSPWVRVCLTAPTDNVCVYKKGPTCCLFASLMLYSIVVEHGMDTQHGCVSTFLVSCHPMYGCRPLCSSCRMLSTALPSTMPCATETGQDDWFLDNQPGALPMHPYRLRGTLFDHPKGCPPFTVYQVHIYRQWVDEFTVMTPPQRAAEEPFANMTHAWGGCVPHLQILHKGASVSTISLCTLIAVHPVCSIVCWIFGGHASSRFPRVGQENVHVCLFFAKICCPSLGVHVRNSGHDGELQVANKNVALHVHAHDPTTGRRRTAMEGRAGQPRQLLLAGV